MGGDVHNEVEVIDFATNGAESCIAHQFSDHLWTRGVGVKVGEKPTICGGGYYSTLAQNCRSLNLETGHWSDDVLPIDPR